MLNEESRSKIREPKIDDLGDILDDQEQRLDVYASMSFDDRISLAIDELYVKKNSSRAKRLISAAKLRYPAADINTLILEPQKLSKNRMIALASESYLWRYATSSSMAIPAQGRPTSHMPSPKSPAGGSTKPATSACRSYWRSSIWQHRLRQASASWSSGTAPTTCSSLTNGS